jgi:hypothetical protein
VVSRAEADWRELWEILKVDTVLDESLNELGLPFLDSNRGPLELSLGCNFDDVPESLCIAIELALTETTVLGPGESLLETTAGSVKGTLVVGVARDSGLCVGGMETTVSFFGWIGAESFRP